MGYAHRLSGNKSLAEEKDSGACVLVLEDDAIARRAFRTTLGRAGYTLHEAGSLAEARTLLEHPEFNPDAALLDYRLPDGTGLELVEELLNRIPLCKALVVTGVESQKPATEAARAGAHGYLRKPGSRGDLLAAVADTVHATHEWRRVLRQHGPPRAHEGATEPPPVELDPQAMVARLRHLANLSPAKALTAWRLLWGDTNEEIAELMGCSLRTVKFHVSELLSRTGARSRADLLRVLLEDAGVQDPWKHRSAPPAEIAAWSTGTEVGAVARGARDAATTRDNPSSAD